MAVKKAVKKKQVVKRRVGRPSKLTPTVSKRFFLLLSEGMSLRGICEETNMPTRVTILNWLKKDDEFLTQYEQAKREGLELRAEEMLEIADDGRNDWMEKNDPDNPGYVYNGEHVQRSRLRIDTRKWILSKLLPKKYGESINHNVGGQSDNPLLILARAVQGGSLPIKEIEGD